MTTTNPTIQTVTGLIRRAPSITKSRKYKNPTRRTRSIGLYAEKLLNNEIRIGYNFDSYEFAIKDMKRDMPGFLEFAKAQGFDLIPEASGWSYIVKVA
jgi:hypothetical protein